jgi:Ala-tRNA(Pro) deacylase
MQSCQERLIDFLNKNGVPYETVHHGTAYTAHDVAAQEKVSDQSVAKVVMVLADGKVNMLVLPANLQVDFERLRELFHAQQVRLAQEQEFDYLFPDCQVGAMPPFGNLYNVPVYMDRTLAEDEQIIFNAGTHTDTLKIAFQDYVRLVQPVIATFGMHKRERLLHWAS